MGFPYDSVDLSSVRAKKFPGFWKTKQKIYRLKKKSCHGHPPERGKKKKKKCDRHPLHPFDIIKALNFSFLMFPLQKKETNSLLGMTVTFYEEQTS